MESTTVLEISFSLVTIAVRLKVKHLTLDHSNIIDWDFLYIQNSEVKSIMFRAVPLGRKG